MMTRLLLFGTVILTCLIAPAHAQHDSHDGPAMNFYRIDDSLATSGHLVDGGLAELKEQGVKVVIDLRDEPPEGHGERLAAEGIEWISIPVAWRSPELGDFEKFSAAMKEHAGDNVLVQCQANYRASAFTYMYRTFEAGVPESEAREAMNVVWEPEGTWAEFIDEVEETYSE